MKLNKKMICENNENIIRFANDDEFFDYCVVPVIVAKNDMGNKDIWYADFDFTSTYLNDIANGTKFIILDPNSKIAKRKAVSYRTITKPIQNIMDCDMCI